MPSHVGFGVIFDRGEASSRSRYGGWSPKAEVKKVLAAAAMDLCG